MPSTTAAMAKPTPPGVMRSNSRLKKDLLRLVTNTSRANKTTCSSPTPLSMTASASPARSFSMMTGKMKSIHRRHRSGDKPASPAKADVAITVTSLENRNSPTLGQERAALQEAAGESRSISDISEETVAPRHETFPVEDSTFEGLPEWRSDASSGYTLIDHDFLESAFGITMEDKGDSNGPQVIGRAENPSLDIAGTTDPVSNPELEDDTLSMEIPIQLGKDRRPKIQVTIPDKRPQRYASLPSQNTKMERRTGRNQEISDIVSPPSTTTRHRMDKGTATARLSIVSPLSVVEMPKPRRPFSAFSLEGMMTDMPQHASPPSKSATSNSSDDTGEHDDRLSSYSKRSSMSSIGSEAAMIKLKAGRRPSVPYPVPSPNGADVFESPPSRSKYRKCMKSSTSLNDRPRSPKRMESILSLNEKANRNKPLPPEPKLMDIAPLNVSGQSLSRTSSMRARSKVPPPLNVRDDSSTITPSRRSSKVAASLRSKYTPKDLDALDDAFQKTGSLGLHNLSYTTKSTPSLSQVTLALESHLGTIREDPHINWAVLPLAHDPLQISRGPMRMEPSRKAPPPPPAPRHGSPTHLVLEHFGLESRKRLHKRSASNIHVATQMRYADTSKKRISSLFGSSTKANRVLGKTGGIEFTPVRMDREISSESNWSLSDSPHAYTNSNSPDMSPDEAPTPESDLSSIHDAAFEEVRRRLELLSPKDDPSLTFMAFHEKNASRSSVSITIVPNEQARAAACGEIHDHIAELEALEARRGPSPVELEATESSPRVELNAVPNSPINPRTLPGLIQELVASSADPSPKELLSIQGVHDSRSVRCRSLASLAMSEIPEMYASLPSPKPTYRPSLTAEELEQLISADAAERVLFRILHNLDNLQDLFAAATVSRGFYRTFKRHELPLIQNALWSMSPAAWELRQMSLSDPNERDTHKSSSTRPKDCAALYLQHYMRDMYTMIALKSMILEHCQTFLRADTITALAGGESERSPQLDDAFWRVWSFCKLFGCGKNREDDIVGQMDWLRGGALAKQQGRDTNTLSVVDNVAMNSVLFNPPTGFARGNGNGLTAEELYDMTEIWTCLGVLVRGFHGKREEAREFGIFESANIAPGDVEKEDATLEEWTYHLLTLAPATILDITSPTTPTRSTFAHARSQGYTAWSPPAFGASRSTFLKEAVSRIYEEKETHRHRSAANSGCSTPLPSASPLPAPSADASPDSISAARQRCAVHAAEIRAKKQDPKYKELPISEERPMSNYPAILFKLEQNSPPPPTPALPASSSRINKHVVPAAAAPATNPLPLSSSSSSRLTQSQRASSSQEKEKVPTPFHPPPRVSPPILSPIPSGPQVRDPVDVAVENIVKMGFSEAKAKKALAETDSGNSVDFGRAVEMLVKERKKEGALLGGKAGWLAGQSVM